MFQLGSATPVTLELMPARGDDPAVRVTFNPQPSPLSLRAARRAIAEIMQDGLPDADERAGDAFSAELIRRNILGWEGIGNEAGEPAPLSSEAITAFMASPRLVEAADELYVLPWVRRDAEGNASPPSPNGISEGAAVDTAAKAAKPGSKAAAGTKRLAKRPARTKSTSRERTPAKASGK